MDGIANGHGKLAQLPAEMFHIIKSSSSAHIGARLGRVAVPGRRVMDTPHYLGSTSRGVVPHLTQDTFRRDTNIAAVYVGLEDFIERAPRQVPPIYNFHPPDGSSPLRRFAALPDDTLLVLAARRTPPVVAPPATPNTDTSVAVCTSVGFRSLKPDDYADAAEGLKADILVGLGDIPYGRALGNKRVEKATDRVIQWLQDHVALRAEAKSASQAALFASLLPVSCAKQQFYIDYLTDELKHGVSGLAFFSLEPFEGFPDGLSHLPRLGFTTPNNPHEVLQQVARGLDILTVPFIDSATDAGIALDFHFPGPAALNGSAPLALGVDMWSSTHATDLAPLSRACKCYSCTNHHRAYIQHLLAAKEMLGWVLLQIHNHLVVDLFFGAIRRSIAQDTFEKDTLAFKKAYESQLPEKTGQGPRVRGYQHKAEGPGEAKKNPAAFHTLNDGHERLAEFTPPSEDADAEELQDRGFAEKEQ